MNQINPKKILHSKWTAAEPQNREKHFIVSQCFYIGSNKLNEIEIKAIMTDNVYRIPWRELKDSTVWHIGWK